MSQDIFKLIKNMESQFKNGIDSNADFELPQYNLVRVVDPVQKKQFLFNDELAYVFRTINSNKKTTIVGFELDMKPLEKDLRMQILKNLVGKNYTIVKNFILLEPGIEECISLIDLKKKKYIATTRRNLVEFLLKF